MSDFCLFISNALSPTSALNNGPKIKKIDTVLEKLYTDQASKESKFRELKSSLDDLSDKSAVVDPNGLSRNKLVKNTRYRMAVLVSHIKAIQGNIDKFEGMKFQLERTSMTMEMAAQLVDVKRHMKGIAGIDVEKLKDDIDDVVDIQNDMKDIEETLNGVMVNAWDTDADDMEKQLREYLNEPDDEEDSLIDPVTESRLSAADKIIEDERVKYNKQLKEEAAKRRKNGDEDEEDFEIDELPKMSRVSVPAVQQLRRHGPVAEF